MSEPFIGEIRIFAGNYAPIGWALCAGQLLPISSNTALFSLLGTTYGGDGKVTFALPNFQSRIPMHPGNGPGLTPRDLGEMDGVETVTITPAQAPAHSHVLRAASQNAAASDPAGNVLANSGQAGLYAAGPADTPMSSGVAAPVGGEQPHNNLMPHLAMTFIIATQGVYPQRP